MRRVIAFLAVLFVFVWSTAYGQSVAPWEQVWIPAKESTFGGGTKDINLDAALSKPVGNGPFPLFIWNHGSTGRGIISVKSSERYTALVKVLVNQGFAVIVPMRRGRGASGGYYGESEHTMCDYSQNASGLERAMEDIDAVIAYAKTQPFIDSSRITIGGISRGGFLSVMYGAFRPGVPVTKVFNFVGGWTNDVCFNFNGPMFERAGGARKVPALWVYGERDLNYSDDSIRGYAESFKRGGGEMIFRLYPHDLKDGHSIMLRHNLWLNEFLQFLVGFDPNNPFGK